MEYLERKVGEAVLRNLLREDSVGGPLLLNTKYVTSYNSIHHLYHFIRFQESTTCVLSEVRTVVEWGGGYGNMAKLYRRLSNWAGTYVIIDTPLFSCLQWLYLSTVLGEENVNPLFTAEASLHERKVNLLPICFLNGQLSEVDLFISTWALSESSRYAQEFVAEREWFHSEHVLIAFQQANRSFPDSELARTPLKSAGTVIEPIEFSPGNYYAFK